MRNLILKFLGLRSAVDAENRVICRIEEVYEQLNRNMDLVRNDLNEMEKRLREYHQYRLMDDVENKVDDVVRETGFMKKLIAEINAYQVEK